MTTESIKNIKKISSQVCTRVVKQSRRVSLTQINICVHTKATPSSIIKVNLNETAWLSGAVKFYGTGWSGVAAAMRALVTPLIYLMHTTESALVQPESSKNSYLATSSWNLSCCKLGFELSGFCYSIGWVKQQKT